MPLEAGEEVATIMEEANKVPQDRGLEVEVQTQECIEVARKEVAQVLDKKQINAEHKRVNCEPNTKYTQEVVGLILFPYK